MSHSHHAFDSQGVLESLRAWGLSLSGNVCTFGRRDCLHLVGICALSVGLAACVTVSGTSGRQFKQASLSSPLIKLSDSFYPGDQPVTVDGIVKSLPPAAIETLQTDLRTLMTGLVNFYGLVREFLSAELETALPSSMPLTVEVERAATKTAEIRSDQTIYIDLEVLQAFFRTGVVDLTKSPLSRSPTPADDDDAIVQRFLDFKRRLRNSKGRTIIGDAFAGDDDWFEQVDMNKAMSKATSRYYGVLIFTMAHEMGHSALGHLSETCDVNLCTRFAERELAADRFAATLVAVLLPRQPGLLALFEDNLNLDELRGYEPFFEIGYRRARFSNIGACSCEYPSSDKRLSLASSAAERTWKRLYDDGWMEKFVKANVYKVRR